MLDRLVGASLALLVCAAATYVAVRLIESVAAALLVSAAALGGLILIGFAARALWTARERDRW